MFFIGFAFIGVFLSVIYLPENGLCNWFILAITLARYLICFK